MIEIFGTALVIVTLTAANWLLRIWLGRYTSYVLANAVAAAAVVALVDIIADAGTAYEVPVLRQLLSVQLAILVGGLIWMRLASPRPVEFSRPSTFAPSASSPVERTRPLRLAATRQDSRDMSPVQRAGFWSGMGNLRRPPTVASAVPGVRSRRSRNFFLRYWRGEIPLVSSFWIVVPAVAVFSAVFAFALGKLIEISGAYNPRIVFGAIVFSWTVLIALAAWKIVGLWRWATRDMRESEKRGEMILWGGLVKILLGLAALGIAVDIKQGAAQIREAYAMAFESDPFVPDYALRFMRNGTELEIIGGFKDGLSNDLNQLLKASPQIAVIHLDSPGGRIGEAIQVQNLIQQRGLATYVADECLWACTIAFSAGKERWLASTGKLGFHIDTPAVSRAKVPNVPKKELLEAVDWALLSRNSLDPRLVERAVAMSGEALQIPSERELLTTGVVTGVAPPEKFAMSGFGAKFTLEKTGELLLAVYPELISLSERDPGRVNAIIRQFHQMYLDGRSMGEADAMLHGLDLELAPELDKSLALADDETMILLAKLTAAQYRHLVSVDIATCHKYITDRTTDISSLLTPQLIERGQEIQTRMMRGAQQHPPPTKVDLGEAWQEAMKLLNATPQSQYIHLFNTPPSRSEYASYCWLYASLYDAIGQLAPAKGAALVRQLMSRKS
jgi:hypothetical protein